MTEHQLFYLVFLGQVLLISYILPRRVLQRMRHVVSTYPRAEYPRLYPVSHDRVERAQLAFRNLNLLALVVGLALFAAGVLRPGKDMLGWDTLSVMTLYLMLQLSPLTIATRPGFTYFNPLRKRDTRTKRTADLAPRRLTHFVAPLAVALAFGLYIFFILAVNQLDYPWFGGYWNIAGITLINLMVTAGITYSLLARNRDPYQATADRRRQIGFVVRLAVFTSFAATLSVMLSIILAMLELRPYIPVSNSLYFMLLAAVCFRQFRIDGVNFEVYREEQAVHRSVS